MNFIFIYQKEFKSPHFLARDSNKNYTKIDACRNLMSTSTSSAQQRVTLHSHVRGLASLELLGSGVKDLQEGGVGNGADQFGENKTSNSNCNGNYLNFSSIFTIAYCKKE